MGTALLNESAGESLHADFDRHYQGYQVKDINATSYQKKLLHAIKTYNAGHIQDSSADQWFNCKSLVSLVKNLVIVIVILIVIVIRKKINKDIDFLRGQEKKIVSIFCLRFCGKVGLSLGPNGARSEIYTQGNMDISTHFGLKENCIGRSVWPV